jgi:MbtH protein
MFTEESTTYVVLINDEEQYSLWPKHKKIPEGWRAVEMEGSQEQCSAYVDRVWTDMRPLSLRKTMAAEAAEGDGPLS